MNRISSSEVFMVNRKGPLNQDGFATSSRKKTISRINPVNKDSFQINKQKAFLSSIFQSLINGLRRIQAGNQWQWEDYDIQTHQRLFGYESLNTVVNARDEDRLFLSLRAMVLFIKNIHTAHFHILPQDLYQKLLQQHCLMRLSQKILKKSGDMVCEIHREYVRDHYQIDKARAIRNEDRMKDCPHFSRFCKKDGLNHRANRAHAATELIREKSVQSQSEEVIPDLLIKRIGNKKISPFSNQFSSLFRFFMGCLFFSSLRSNS